MNFTPVNINILQAVYPLVIAGFMRMTKKLADPCGRAQVRSDAGPPRLTVICSEIRKYYKDN
eukprot:2082477-Amphidinium_carterae.1